MKKLNIIGALIVFLLISACQNNKTIEHYFVEKQNEQGFVIMDLPSSLLETDNLELDDKAKDAITSIRKLNILLARHDNIKLPIAHEKAVVNEIMQNKMYENLLSFQDSDNQVSVYVVDKNEKIDEIIVFGSQKNETMIIVRLLGKNMKFEHLSSIVKLISEQEKTLELEKILSPLFNNSL